MTTATATTKSLYNGEVELKFSPAGHRYTVNGKRAVGVTTILNAVTAKEALTYWAVKECLEVLRKEIKPDTGYTAEQLEALFLMAKGAHTLKRDTSADIGVQVHSYISDYIKGLEPAMPSDPGAAAGARSFLDWEKQTGAEFISSEEPVYSRIADYAGCYDAIFKVDSKYYMADFKTGEPNRIYDSRQKRYTGAVRAYPQHFLQCAAYDWAYNDDLLVSKGHTLNFDGHAVIYLTKKGQLYDFISTEVRQNVEGFLAAVALYRNTQRLSN